MSGRPTRVVSATVVVALMASGCAAKVTPPSATPKTSAQVVLLKDVETNAVGRVLVSNAAGNVELAGERDSTRITVGAAPDPRSVMTEAEVMRLFGSALSALPPAPARFTLNFRLGSEELADESRAQITSVIAAILRRPTPYVTVIGHTDTTGKDVENFALGLARAHGVRNLLIQSGLAAAAIEVLSLGERDLLIATADDTPEPRNRRVEIAVR
jgi:outer membrane protein OmpA-like peptidoglycan-associated protein